MVDILELASSRNSLNQPEDIYQAFKEQTSLISDTLKEKNYKKASYYFRGLEIASATLGHFCEERTKPYRGPHYKMLDLETLAYSPRGENKRGG